LRKRLTRSESRTRSQTYKEEVAHTILQYRYGSTTATISTVTQQKQQQQQTIKIISFHVPRDFIKLGTFFIKPSLTTHIISQDILYFWLGIREVWD
jgi:hypothetical protein